MTEVACWAHCRRKIFDAWEATAPTSRQGSTRLDRPALCRRGRGERQANA
ncbi:MAG: hypothetical protein E5Y01_30335 [Mesorhizobium sp.]|nr:MAG: hypothetical protein EOR75_30550 [Mesorhizobium sp.]TIO72993.1 MAG: hypothetical protein E5X75_30230 [Mesorhizobium sp.]TJV47984.1 MAG: hypothetical protein E5Y01_30335 [Mesorhizobium sp.]